MKSLDRQSLEEQTRLVSRYVAGDLSRSERAEFEAWLVASPELASEVEMERRLRRGIASAARRGWLKPSALAQPGPDRRWRVAVAASLVVSLTTLGLSLVLPRHAVEQTAAARPTVSKSHLATTRTVSLSTVRGVGNSADVFVVCGAAADSLVFEPDVVVLTCVDGSFDLECVDGSAPSTPLYSEYEMELVNRHGSTLAWRSSREIPVARSQLAFTLREPGNLAVGDYDLLVRGHSPDHAEIVARFWLRVTAK